MNTIGENVSSPGVARLSAWPQSWRRAFCIKLCGQRLLLRLWRAPVVHGVEPIGLFVIERDSATAYFPVPCGATELLGQSLLLGGLPCGLGLALRILVGHHHPI